MTDLTSRTFAALAGVNLTHLSVRTGISRKTMNDWKNGHTSPRLDLFESMIEAAGMEIIVRKKESAS
ncbi:helix-turn-helix domain-containing protein [Rhizobium phaseoli]|uniref:helix-turn-helix domain-containing protein n=1 Tax=Rhizobium phaseoli TaxID=396 RepID=UPI00255589EA|nr:helix-turn-helix transcriptional regulator [Rhizobium phaseoli]MDK4729366.1 helix-turn-helix transcriptional regulator [Rhizobium phaseoli]